MAHRAGERMRIDEKVRDAHLNHFCPGGASFPVTTSRPIGLDLEAAAGPPSAMDASAARANGKRCGRCDLPITAGQDARRRAGGAWVHESCPRNVVATR
jgi:hypothetical protein